MVASLVAQLPGTAAITKPAGASEGRQAAATPPRVALNDVTDQCQVPLTETMATSNDCMYHCLWATVGSLQEHVIDDEMVTHASFCPATAYGQGAKRCMCIS